MTPSDRRPGRPPKHRVQAGVRLPSDLLAEVDAVATRQGRSRADVIEDYVRAGLVREGEGGPGPAREGGLP